MSRSSDLVINRSIRSYGVRCTPSQKRLSSRITTSKQYPGSKLPLFQSTPPPFCCKVKRIGQRQNFPLIHIARAVFGSPKDFRRQNRFKDRSEHIQGIAAADIRAQSDCNSSIEIFHDWCCATATVHIRLWTMCYQHIASFQRFHLFGGGKNAVRHHSLCMRSKQTSTVIGLRIIIKIRCKLVHPVNFIQPL